MPAQVATRRRVLVRPATELTHMTRYRGGTYSHTVDTIVFADGSTARTDLIRLNPNVHAYSLDFTGIAPHHPSRYRLGTWSTLPHLRTRGYEAEVDWILRHSFPMRPDRRTEPTVARGRLPAGAGQHQRTRSHRGNPGRDLAFHQWPGAGYPAAERSCRGTAGPRAGDHLRIRRPTTAGRLLGVDSLGRHRHLKLQKSANGVDWQDVSGSQLTTDAAKGRYQRTLGVGSTLSASSHGRGGRGYRYYRLIANGRDRRTRRSAMSASG